MRNTIMSMALASVLVTSMASSITPAYASSATSGVGERGLASGFEAPKRKPAKKDRAQKERPQADRQDNRQDRRDDRHDNRGDRRDDIRDEIAEERRQEARQDRRQTRRVARRTARRVSARHGHYYPGYGYIYVDNDAWKWIAFAGITFAILDAISEEAQRAHEAAQIAATTAAINEVIRWQNGASFGQVVATREYIGANGLTYRDFSHTNTVHGQTETLVVTGYHQADGPRPQLS